MANRTLKVFRKTAVSDNFAGVPVTDKLEFNTTTSTATGNGWTTRIDIIKGRDVAENSNPNQELGESQDTGLGEVRYEIEGSYSRPDDATSQFTINLSQWADIDQESLVMPFGRWSVISDDHPLNGTTATDTVGLKITLLHTWVSSEVPNEGKFILHLTKAIEAS